MPTSFWRLGLLQFTRPFLVLFSHITALLLLSLFSFTRNSGRLLTGLDGPVLASVSEEQFSFFGITPNLHSNILEGLGNTSVASNLTFMPDIYHVIGTFTPAAIFTWFALQLFICILLLGWNYRFDSRVSYIAAWLLTILFLPYFEYFRIYSITEAAPNCIEIILVFTLMDIGIQHMGSINWLNTFAYGTLSLLGFILGLILCPTALILVAPILLLTTICSFMTAKSRSEFSRKLVMGLAILFIAITAGWLHYIVGLILNTAANVYYSQQTGFYHSLIYASILFHKGLPASEMGPWLFSIATLGIVLAILKSPKLRPLAITILIAQLFIVGGGAILMSQPNSWRGPSPIYWEITLLPFYSLFFTYFLIKTIDNIFFARIPIWLNVTFPFVIAITIAVYFLAHHPFTNRG
jgi:hypothetical protein